MSIDISPLWISIKTAIGATALTSILGITIAYVVSNYKGKFKGILDAIFTIPIILPPTVVGFFLLLILGKNGIIGSVFINFGSNLIFSWTATVISAVVVSFPIMYRASRGAFEQIDETMILAAKTLGLDEWYILKKIVLPLALPGIVGGIILSFTRAIGEFGATLMIAGNIPGKTQTIPIAIFFAVESGRMDIAMMWVIIIMLISGVMILALNYLLERQQKMIGKRRN